VMKVVMIAVMSLQPSQDQNKGSMLRINARHSFP